MSVKMRETLSVKVRAKKMGGHWHVTVWIGKDANLTHGNCGELVFREEEWPIVRDRMFRMAQITEEGET